MKQRMLLIDFLIVPSDPHDLPCALVATAPPRVIVGYPGSWGIHKLYFREKFKIQLK